MNFPTITRYNWMCCSIIFVILEDFYNHFISKQF